MIVTGSEQQHGAEMELDIYKSKGIGGEGFYMYSLKKLNIHRLQGIVVEGIISFSLLKYEV